MVQQPICLNGWVHSNYHCGLWQFVNLSRNLVSGSIDLESKGSVIVFVRFLNLTDQQMNTNNGLHVQRESRRHHFRVIHMEF